MEVGVHKIFLVQDMRETSFTGLNRDDIGKARKAWSWWQHNRDRWSVEGLSLLFSCVILAKLLSLSWSASSVSKDSMSTFLISLSIQWDNVCNA